MSHEPAVSATGDDLSVPGPVTRPDPVLAPSAHTVLWCVAAGRATTDDLVTTTSISYDECVAVADTLERAGYVASLERTHTVDLPRALGTFERTVLELWVTGAGWAYIEALGAHPLVEDWVQEHTFGGTAVPLEISELDRDRTPPLFVGPDH